MPTIDDLPAAPSVGDSDELMVSQSGISRKATRSQINAGLQAQIFLPQGSLLGRMSAGTGGLETIAIGANLTVAQGSISAPAAFSISDCATVTPVQATDLVPLSQGGQNANLAYAAFMSGLSELAGINASGLEVTAVGTPQGRSLAAIASDAIPVEAFGAAGDGATDDTAAFQLALASGRPLRLDAKVYVLNGVLTISTPTALIGVAQGSIIRRLMLTNGGTWISVTAGQFYASGIKFDAGSLASSDAPALSVAPSCGTSWFFQCVFQNATGSTAGSGLSVQTGESSLHTVAQCAAYNNALHGVAFSGAGAATICGCTLQGNTGYGVSVSNGVATTISDNICSTNQCGISIGSWNAVPFTRSTATPTAIRGNQCNSNINWGIAAACTGAQISGNTLSGNGSVTSGGGILGRLAACRVSDNVVSGGATGIDGRSSSGCQLFGNAVSSTTTGLTVGGSQNMMVSGNFLAGNLWGIIISAIEPTLSPTPTSSVNIEGNWIGFSMAQGGGISVLDGAQGIAVIENRLTGSGSATVDQALWVHTDQAILRGNSWNNAARFSVSSVTIGGLPTVVVPDVADEVLVLSAPPGIQSILTSHQVNTLGQISFVRVLSGGTNYTTASITISGSGSGAQAKAIIENGSVAWVVMTTPGSGYGSIGAPAAVTINGDGTGATAQAYVGVPVIEGKTLRIACNTTMRLLQAGSAPPFTSWTGFDTTIPAYGAVELEGTFGQWRAVENPPVDYLLPTGNGGAILQSVSGADLTLCPSDGGVLQIASAGEPAGYTTSVGRGSPEGVVAAPPGSDFRNLDGGVGSTLWVKQVGSDNQGWVAIA